MIESITSGGGNNTGTNSETYRLNKNANSYSTTSIIIPPDVGEEIFGIGKKDILKNRTLETTLSASSYTDIITAGEGTMLYFSLNNGCSSFTCPDDFIFHVSIISGGEYGELYDWSTGNSGQTIDQPKFYDCGTELTYEANGIKIAEMDTVIIKVGCSMAGVDPQYITLFINPAPIQITIIPNTLAPGDTADVILKKLDRENKVYNLFTPEQVFEIGLPEGCNYGTLLLSDGRENGYFPELQGVTVKFIANENLEEDSADVYVLVGINDENSAEQKSSGKEKTDWKQKLNRDRSKLSGTQGAACPVNFYSTIIKLEKAVINNHQDNSILLGESKYYEAKLNSQTNKITIEEIKPGADGVPHLKTGTEGDWEWLTTDVWGSDPVANVGGDKLGVYWEKEKPIWGTNQRLSTGLIRLIGRYWKEGDYKVRLTATKNSIISAIEIIVQSPNKLGADKVGNIEFINFTDVFGHPQIVNDYCIINSGTEGVPPQLVKAQGFKESKFKPAYRYEPWKDIEINNNPDKKRTYFGEGNTFVVTSNSMGKGKSIPLNHINLGSAVYSRVPTKCQDIIARDLTSRYWIRNQHNV